MDNHLQQAFDISYLKIGAMVNGGVLQIGCGSVEVQRVLLLDILQLELH